MPERTRIANAAKSAVRSRVEHVFAVQKDRMDLFIRTIGLARATTKIGMANIVYNIKRLLVLRRTGAAPVSAPPRWTAPSPAIHSSSEEKRQKWRQTDQADKICRSRAVDRTVQPDIELAAETSSFPTATCQEDSATGERVCPAGILVRRDCHGLNFGRRLRWD